MTCLCDHHFERARKMCRPLGVGTLVVWRRETKFAMKFFSRKLIKQFRAYYTKTRSEWSTRDRSSDLYRSDQATIHDFVFPLSATSACLASPRSRTEHVLYRGLESGPPLQQWHSGGPKTRRIRKKRPQVGYIIFTITLQNNRPLLCQDPIHPQISVCTNTSCSILYI